jgi:hypothetical protein
MDSKLKAGGTVAESVGNCLKTECHYWFRNRRERHTQIPQTDDRQRTRHLVVIVVIMIMMIITTLNTLAAAATAYEPRPLAN